MRNRSLARGTRCALAFCNLLPKARMPKHLTDDTILAIDACWRAANYLTVGQIYLLDNVLLREPLRAEHIKPRLLGHWGTSPGLSLLYAHLNRVIVERDLDVAQARQQLQIVGGAPGI